MAFTVQPTGNRVLLRPLPADERTPGGVIVVSQRGNGGLILGTVVAVGPGKFEAGTWCPLPCQVADEVYYLKQSGIDIQIEGAEHHILDGDDVLATRRGGA